MKTETLLPAIVDDLAKVLADIAILESREKELKKILASCGLKEICGSTSRAVVSTIAESVTVSWREVAMELDPPQSLVDKHSKPRASSVRVQLYGYN